MKNKTIMHGMYIMRIMENDTSNVYITNNKTKEKTVLTLSDNVIKQSNHLNLPANLTIKAVSLLYAMKD